jgi:hypothetical protein
VATYGRGAWVADISTLQEAGAAGDIHFFDIEPRTQRVYGGIGNFQLLGNSHLFTPNEPNAIVVNYFLKTKAEGGVKIKVADVSGAIQAELVGKGDAGMNTVLWGMRPQRAGQGGQRGAGMGGGAMVDPGEYTVTLEAAGTTLSKKAVIRARQGWTVGPVPTIIKR